MDILQALWELESGTVAEIHARLVAGGNDVAYTTVQTMLNRLFAKKVVARSTDRRTLVYRPVLREKAALKDAIGLLARRFFRGSVERLASHLVEHDLTPTQVRRVNELIASRRAGKSR